MFKKAPAWTIQGKKQSKRKQQNPSPCHYTVGYHSQHNQPVWKIGTQKRNHTKLEIKPDPTTYHPENLKQNKKYGKFSKQKKLIVKANQVPDSAHYSPNHRFIQKNTGNVRIPLFQKKQRQENVPGPGQYSYALKNLEKSHSGPKFNKSRKLIANKTQGPSPAQYSPNLKKFAQKSVSFTKQVKFLGTTDSLLSPGPGSYNKTDYFRESVLNNKGFSMISRHQQKIETDSPGPGKYNPTNVVYSESPKHSFASKYVEGKKQLSPGPLDYFITQPGLRAEKGYSIGKEQRTTIEKNSNPGPGDYNPRKTDKSSPQYSMGLSKIFLNPNLIPGPGYYHPNSSYIQNRPKSAKIGKSQRNTFNNNKTPGPGQYQTKSIRPSTAKTVFGKAQRLKIKTYQTPGPGQYQSLTIFGSLSKANLIR